MRKKMDNNGSAFRLRVLFGSISFQARRARVSEKGVVGSGTRRYCGITVGQQDVRLHPTSEMEIDGAYSVPLPKRRSWCSISVFFSLVYG